MRRCAGQSASLEMGPKACSNTTITTCKRMALVRTLVSIGQWAWRTAQHLRQRRHALIRLDAHVAQFCWPLGMVALHEKVIKNTVRRAARQHATRLQVLLCVALQVKVLRHGPLPRLPEHGDIQCTLIPKRLIW